MKIDLEKIRLSGWLVLGLITAAACDDSPTAPRFDLLRLVPDTLYMVPGDTARIQVQASSQGVLIVSPRPSWTSRTPAIADVADGLVTARTPGTTRIVASGGSLTDSTFVIVRAQAASGTFAQIELGYYFGCARTAAGLAYCWGNGGPALGSSSTVVEAVDLPTRVLAAGFTTISAGGQHVCGLDAAGLAQCWGMNQSGQVGAIDPGQICAGSQRCHPIPVPVETALRFRQISAGGSHTCGTTATNEAYCWGYGGHGRLGDNGGQNRPSPTRVLRTEPFAIVVAGGSHTCGLDTAGRAYCWGYGESGQLGGGGTTSGSTAVSGGHTFSQIDLGGMHSCALASDGALYCWGVNDHGQLGDGTNTNRAAPVRAAPSLSFTAFALGPDHTCGLTGAGNLYCWGSNEAGQLGNGTQANSNVPVAVLGGLQFTSVSANYFSTCGNSVDGLTYCWGTNYRGALGTGSSLLDQRMPTRVAEPAG